MHHAIVYESSEFTKRRLVYYPWSQWNFQCSNAEFCLAPTKIDESVIVPHQSALYGYVINGDVAQCLWGHMWLWFWSGVACSWTGQSFLVLWFCGVLGLGLAVSLVWTVVVVVEEMLCANSKMRLLAHDDLTWNNNLSSAIPPHSMEFLSVCGLHTE